MDPEIDRHIAEHVTHMHRYCTDDGGIGAFDKGTRYTEEDDGGDVNAPIFVKYDRVLHGHEKRKGKRQRNERLTIKFLKKYVHYAKNRIQPKLTDEAAEHIATLYAELRDASSNAKSGGGTLPITARTLETVIRLSTAHAKLKLRNEVLKVDVEAALMVLNFAIYHKELTDMEEREQREREMEMKQKVDQDRDHDADVDERTEAMEVDEVHEVETEDISSERIEAFETILGQHVLANHIDQISISEVERLVNHEAPAPYTRQQVESILERMQDANRVMIRDGILRII